MRIGLAIPQVGLLADPAASREVAVEAEQSGYSSLWAMDRLLAPIDPMTRYPATPDGVLPPEQSAVLDPLGVLTLAAAVTRTIRIGTSVLVGPWYPAALLARSLTTLDRISEGRLTVGLGLGWSADEYAAVGVAQQGLAGRSEELLDVLDAWWSPDPIVYRGDNVDIRPARVGVKPVQQPGPPVLLAAYTPAGLDRVARRAAGWTPAGLPVAALAPMWSTVRDGAAAHGRDAEDLSLVVRANVKLTDRPLGADRPSYCGTVEQVAGDLVATRDAGADEIVIDAQGDARSGPELLAIVGAIVEAADLTAAA
jgi:probable F420-dependent oxidoreductase